MSVGRPSKFCQEVIDKIIEKLRNGRFLSVAAASAGVNRWTVNRWLRRGKRSGESDKPYREFRQRYIEARALRGMMLRSWRSTPRKLIRSGPMNGSKG